MFSDFYSRIFCGGIHIAKPLAYIAGIIAIIGVFLTVLIRNFGFWNATLIADPLIGETSTFEYWFSAVFGIGRFDGDVVSANPLYGVELVQWIGGILMLVGGILCLTHSKLLAIIGSCCILAGIVLWVIIFPDIAKVFVENLGGDPNLITFGSIFSGSQQYNNIIFTEFSLTYKAGFGLYIEALAGILGLVGAFIGSDHQ